MEYISFRTDKNVLRQIEKGMKEFHYSTKSDFLRDAIRTKLQMLEEERARKKAWKALASAKGIFKGKTKTSKEFRELTEKAAEQFLKKFD